MKKCTILGIFAHPDDESFGPGGTLAKYANQGENVITITVTRGQAGQSSNKQIIKDLGYHRELELKKAAKILGVNQTIILDFYDGTLSQNQLPILKSTLAKEINSIKPDILIVFEKTGISYHLDHIAITQAVSELYEEKIIHPKKFYYFGLCSEMATLMGRKCHLDENRLAKIDINPYWETKLKAIQAHASQDRDSQRILRRSIEARKKSLDFWHYEYFELVSPILPSQHFPETDLLSDL